MASISRSSKVVACFRLYSRRWCQTLAPDNPLVIFFPCRAWEGLDTQHKPRVFAPWKMREAVLLPPFLSLYQGHAFPYNTSSSRQRVSSIKACNQFVCVSARTRVFLYTCFVFRVTCSFCVSHAFFLVSKGCCDLYSNLYGKKSNTWHTISEKMIIDLPYLFTMLL